MWAASSCRWATTNGTTNAVMFGVVLMALRDADLNVHREPRPSPR